MTAKFLRAHWPIIIVNKRTEPEFNLGKTLWNVDVSLFNQ